MLGADVITIGDHVLLRGDVARGDVASVMCGDRADVVYSDPPWGPGNLRYWGTHARQVQRAEWPAFLVAFCGAVTKPASAGAIFVEMGLRWIDDLARVMAQFGRSEVARWTVQYGRPLRPNALWYSGLPLPVGFDPTRLRGAALVRYCVGAVAKPGGIVLDPCCGEGYSARAAVAHGMRFRGVELNASRLAITAAWLERHS